jgi:hypothetical protein
MIYLDQRGEQDETLSATVRAVGSFKSPRGAETATPKSNLSSSSNFKASLHEERRLMLLKKANSGANWLARHLAF